MRYRKITALILATAMVAGNGMAAFAADGDPANSATGEGTLLPHLNKEITAVTLPTEAAVANIFNYNVDPEQLIQDAGKLTDGTAVTGNTDGVYFVNRTAGTAAVPGTAAYTSGTNTGNYTVTVSDLSINDTYTYDGSTDNQWKDSEGNAAGVTITITDNDNSGAEVTPADGDTVTVSGATAGTSGSASYSSTSDAVTFEGKNSVDVDVVVQAKVVKTGDGTKDITLVADDAALTAATTPALLMTLDVGGTEKAITSAGITARATLDGVPGNFTVDTENGAYKYAVKADAAGWKSTTIKLKGKTNNQNVPEGANALTVPKIQLTWSVVKKGETPTEVAYGNWSGAELWMGKDSNTGFSTTGLTVEVSDGGTTYKTLASGKYTVSETGWVSTTWNNMVDALESEPAGNIFVRITDGGTRYVFENK